MESGKKWENVQIENTRNIGCFVAFSESSIRELSYYFPLKANFIFCA